ncbi:MAG: epoxyqueuosine reductase [Bacillota bacterium]|nr:epoxyqueuosine reductase [Bacillota bacterium]
MIKTITKALIIDTIGKLVEEEKESCQTSFGQPLVGFVAANDPALRELKQVTHSEHLMPEDLLAGAETVIAYFLPFTKELVLGNRAGTATTEAWALAYKEANSLLAAVGQRLLGSLEELGIKGAGVKPTHNFDEKTLLAGWSHRHLAYLAGLGQFGLNRMLITSKGCAGRYGSIVIDAKVEGLQQDSETRAKAGVNVGAENAIHPCLYYQQGSCLVCVKNCPSGALTKEGFDRHKCYSYMLADCEERFKHLGVSDVCGKCLATPCAVR